MRDKVVIITGASSGIGKALAYELAHQGAKVVLAARNIEELLHIEQDLRQQGAEVLSVRTDVTKELACKELIEQAYARFGRIDALINNAGISMRALLEDLEPAVLRKVMDVNFWGTVYCSKYALPYLLESKGSLVGVISIAGFIGLPGRTGYAASKFAVRGFLNTVRIENEKRTSCDGGSPRFYSFQHTENCFECQWTATRRKSPERKQNDDCREMCCNHRERNQKKKKRNYNDFCRR